MEKKYYAYIIPASGKQGVAESWEECGPIVSGVKGARFRGFASRKNAEEWLRTGANYRLGIKKIKAHKPLEEGIYFDAGTGRGLGFVEVNVTNKIGASMLAEILDSKQITKFGTYHIPDRNATNNFGELTGLWFALQIAEKKNIKKIFGDSKLVIQYWSKGFIKKETMSDATYELIERVKKMRIDFEERGGTVEHVSGDVNPADLGFHQ